MQTATEVKAQRILLHNANNIHWFNEDNCIIHYQFLDKKDLINLHYQTTEAIIYWRERIILVHKNTDWFRGAVYWYPPLLLGLHLVQLHIKRVVREGQEVGQIAGHSSLEATSSSRGRKNCKSRNEHSFKSLNRKSGKSSSLIYIKETMWKI